MEREILKERLNGLVDSLYDNDIEDEDGYYQRASDLLHSFHNLYNHTLIPQTEDLHRKKFPGSEKYVLSQESIQKQMEEDARYFEKQKEYADSFSAFAKESGFSLGEI